MKSLTTLVLAAAVLATPLEAQWRPQIEEGAITVPRGDLFIRNLDAVWTANDSVYHNASILIRNGVIRAIGTDLEPPSGVTVIDGTGQVAIPGLVDEHTHTGQRATHGFSRACRVAGLS